MRDLRYMRDDIRYLNPEIDRYIADMDDIAIDRAELAGFVAECTLWSAYILHVEL